ncbi:hypothetical protein Aduo_009725 [Ancylostoma duodenale]
MTAVDRSFCVNRYMERGLCIKFDELFYCVYDDGSSDCTGGSSSIVTSTAPAELSTEDIVLVASVGLALLLVLAVLFFCVLRWCRCLCCRRRRGGAEPVSGMSICVLRGLELDKSSV